MKFQLFGWILTFRAGIRRPSSIFPGKSFREYSIMVQRGATLVWGATV